MHSHRLDDPRCTLERRTRARLSYLACHSLAAPTAKEDLEFPHVVVETGVVDGYNPIEPGTRLEGRRRLLCFFLHRHLSFRLPEFQGVAELTYGRTTWDDGLPVTVWERALDDMARGPFWYVHLPDDGDGLALKNGKIIAENCFLLKALIDPWADAHSLPELKERLAAFDPVEKAKFGAASWKAQPETWGMSLTQDQKVAMLMELAPSLPEFHGPISLKNPEQIYWIVASWPFEFPVAYLRSWIFFGRQVGIGTNRGTILNKYDLSRRRYLGPTTMDTELAFLMCSLAGVRRSSLVFDPFVGTGGLLVPAAHHGARTMGMDIDIRVIKWGKKDSTWFLLLLLLVFDSRLLRIISAHSLLSTLHPPFCRHHGRQGPARQHLDQLRGLRARAAGRSAAGGPGPEPVQRRNEGSV